AERLARQRAEALNLNETDVGEELQQVAVEVDVVDCRLALDLAAADEDVRRSLRRRRRVVAGVVKKVDVAEGIPAFRNGLLEETLGDEVRFQGESPAGLQGAKDSFEEIAVAVLTEVREAVAEAEGVVEVIFPGQAA